MIDEHMFYSRTDVCQRSFFFSLPPVGRVHSIQMFGVCSLSLRVAWVQPEHPLKSWRNAGAMLKKKAAKGCHPRLGGVSGLTSDSCLVLRARLCSSVRQSVTRSPAGHFSDRIRSFCCHGSPFQIVLYIFAYDDEKSDTWGCVRGPLGPDPTAGEFTRTATPNGARRGSGTQWVSSGRKMMMRWKLERKKFINWSQWDSFF